MYPPAPADLANGMERLISLTAASLCLPPQLPGDSQLKVGYCDNSTKNVLIRV